MINRYIAIGFVLVLAGAVLPFLIVIHVLPSTLPLNFLSYACSVGGLMLGVAGAAVANSERRRGTDRDTHEDGGRDW